MIVKTEPLDFAIPVVDQKDTIILRLPAPAPQPLRRRGKVEVLLPTRKRLFGDNPPVFENASVFIEKNKLLDVVKKEEENKLAILFSYGKVEIKKEEMLSEDVINRRLALVPAYDVALDPAIRDVTTTRQFTSKRWGGNTQATFPDIRKEMLARHGMDDFMYLNLLYNPHAPQWPGSPGLFFASAAYGNATEWAKLARVLVRLKANCWLYVGQYECTPALSLTPDEWKSQAPKVQQTWATNVSKHDWGIDIRAKIVLRKRLRRIPTINEIRDAVNSNEKFHATPDEIHRAFDEGHAIIQSWCMRCAGYDENFQREIAAGNAAD